MVYENRDKAILMNMCINIVTSKYDLAWIKQNPEMYKGEVKMLFDINLQLHEEMK